MYHINYGISPADIITTKKNYVNSHFKQKLKHDKYELYRKTEVDVPELLWGNHLSCQDRQNQLFYNDPVMFQKYTW